jgi:hypothetical protein
MLTISAAAGSWFLRGSGQAGWTDRQRYAIAAGIFFFQAVGPFIELTGVRDQIVVGIVSGWLFVRQWRRLRAREASGPVQAEIPAPGTPAAAGPIPGTRRT